MGVINVLNAEKFRKEILENSNVVFDFSMSKDKHTIKKCLGVCDDCFFHEAGDHCSNIKVKWLLSEYKEPVKLTRFEYDILKHLSDNTKYLYITRDRCNRLFLYGMEPTKGDGYWQGKYYAGMSALNKLFQFIKWEDSTPTPIKDVLDNCEVVNDAEE